jgi:putative spermidine/putrescine transport system ATP-binding protein
MTRPIAARTLLPDNSSCHGGLVTEPTHKLRIRGLRKSYGSVVALAGTDLEMMEGEFVTLLGPSGSGKTTMLLLIAGLIQPDAGEIWIDGKLCTYMPPHQRDIGVVFQNYALFPHMTLYENIAFPLRMRRFAESRIREEVRRVLAIVQLSGVEDRLPSQLSGGQQQRVALARCMVYQPPIILMDEPLGALDKKLRQQLQLEIRHLHQRLGITVLYVTHDQEEALAMSDRICLMKEGEIEQIGTPGDLYFRPRTVFAADFLGESNLLDAVVTARSDRGVELEGPDRVSIKAMMAQASRPGEKVKFMVRPESLRVLAAGEEADNQLSGRLRDVILLGPVTKYYARLADGTDVSAAQLTRPGQATLEPGDEVRLGFDRESAVGLPLLGSAGRE